MDLVLRGVAIYFFLLLVFRIAGKRSIAQITTFDFVLLLIISEATQQALLGEDFSFTGGAVLIITLLTLDTLMSLLKRSWPRLDRWVEGTPLVLVDDGRVLEDRLRRTRVSLGDVLAAARESHGLERLEQIKYAVLERSGGISVIPREE